jgi:hypothetical protein
MLYEAEKSEATPLMYLHVVNNLMRIDIQHVNGCGYILSAGMVSPGVGTFFYEPLGLIKWHRASDEEYYHPHHHLRTAPGVDLLQALHGMVAQELTGSQDCGKVLLRLLVKVAN